MAKFSVNLQNQKRLALVAGGLVGLFLLWYLLLSISFSAESMRAQTLAALSSHVGSEVTALPGEQLSLLPTPKLVLNSLQVKNPAKSRYPSMMNVPNVVVEPSLASIFGDLIVSVTFQRPKIELESFADGSHSWQMLEAGTVQGPQALIQNLNFQNGSLHYSHPDVTNSITLEQLFLGINFRSAKDYSLGGRFNLYRDRFRFGYEAASNGTRKLSLDNASTHYELNGQWQEDSARFEGTQRLNSKDIGHVLSNFLVSGTQPPALAQGDDALPLTVESKLILTDSRLSLPEMKLSGKTITGGGQVLMLRKAIPELTAQLELENFSIDTLIDRHLFDEMIRPDASQGRGLPQNQKSSLTKALKMTLSLKSKQAKLRQVEVEQMQLAARLQRGELELPQLSGKLKGGGQFLFKGEIAGSYDGLAFKGTGDVAGTNFASVASGMMEGDDESSAESGPVPKALKRYRASANIYYTPKVLRVSETVLRVEDRQLVGTLVRHNIAPANATKEANSKGRYRYEGAFRLSGIQLDEWVARQFGGGAKNSKTDSPDFTFVTHEVFFDWVKALQQHARGSLYNFKIRLAEPVFHGKKRDDYGVRVILNAERLVLSELEIPYNGSFIQGSSDFGFDKITKKPEWHGNLVIDRLDTNEFMEQDYSSNGSMWRNEDGSWSRKEFFIQGLDEIETDLKLYFGKIRHAEYAAEQLKTRLIIEDGSLRFDDLEAKLWQGDLAANLKMVIAKLPTFSGSLSLQGFNFAELHSVTNLFSNLYGRGSVQMNFSTTGVNPTLAIQNLQGSASFAGSNLKVVGFNLANMVRAANAVRTVNDIEKLIKFANRGGETKISTIQGNISLSNGKLSTPLMQIATPYGNGNIKGQINLLNWQTNIGISIYLTALAERNPPDIRLLFVGPLQQVERSLDTQTLESFIAKQAAERLLVNP